MANWLDPIRRLFRANSRIPTADAQSMTPPTNRNDPSVVRDFVDGLVNRGYLSFVDRPQQTQVKGQLAYAVTNGVLLTEPDDCGVYPARRLYHTDAEDLSEGIAFAIQKLTPVLGEVGVQFRSASDANLPYTSNIHGDVRVGLQIDETEYLIYDWPNREPPDLDTWGLAHRRLVEIVTERLIAAGSRERLYGMNGFNDAHVILLTEELFEFIRSSSILFDDEWLPKTVGEMTLTHQL